MHPAIRVTLGIIIGTLVAFGLVAVIEAIGHKVYPIPPDVDISNLDQVKAYAATLPAGALVLVVAGWIIGTLGGGLAGSPLARHRAVLISGFVGALMMCATILNLVLIPHPVWMAIAAVVGIVLAAWFAGRLMRRP
jgi:hypothetical protein